MDAILAQEKKLLKPLESRLNGCCRQSGIEDAAVNNGPGNQVAEVLLSTSFAAHCLQLTSPSQEALQKSSEMCYPHHHASVI